MNEKRIQILERALAREKAARKQAERILEDRSAELYSLSQKLKESNSKLEELLSEKTSQLRGVFENIIDAYVLMDLQGNVLKMNDAATDLFGYNLEEEKLNVVSLIYKKDFDYAMESYGQLVDKGHFTNYTSRIYTKKGETKWIHINASLIFDTDSKPIAAQGIVRDITRARLDAELIEEQKRELDIIVENSSLGIVLTQKGKIVNANRSFQKLSGYTGDELTNLSVADMTHPEDIDTSKKYLFMLDSGEIDNFVIDKRYKRKDGSTVLAKTSVSAVRDLSGNIKYQVAIIEDVTLEREKALMLYVINEVAKAIIGKVDIHEIAWEITNIIANYLGADDCVIYLVNKNENKIEQIAAYGDKVSEKKSIVNKIFIPFGKGIVGSVASSGIAEIVSDSNKDSRYIVDDVKRRSEITVPIITEGEVIGVIDSEHKEKGYYTKDHLQTLENIARLVAMQLKNAINLKERRLVEEKNVQLVSQLEKSNNELEEYAHIVSHDLKSPLRSIYALIDWIKEDNKGVFNSESLYNMSLIQETLEKMEQLISDVLDYSSITSDDTLVQKVDLNEVIEDVTKLLFIPSHISINVKSKLPVIQVDKVRILQIFQNLISNAVRYIDKEKGFITVDFQNKKKHYQFSVADNGIGIPKEFHQKIFKIFQSLNEDKESSGIGLSIVKKIVSSYGGRIWLESELGKGTTFYFTLRKK